MPGLHVYQVPDVAVMKERDLQNYWYAIVEYKKAFFENKTVDLRIYPYMNPEVVESWKRSKKAGVNPFRLRNFLFMDDNKLEETLREYGDLIEATKYTVAEIKMQQIMPKNYAFYLFTENGILLYMEGDKGAVGSAARVGAIWKETTIGTNAHVLCTRSKRPYTIIGPEHYCEIFQNSIVTAAPIRNNRSQIIAAVVLGVHLFDYSLSKVGCIRDIIGLIDAIAVAVENRLRLMDSYTQLQIAQKMNRITMSLIEESIIIVNEEGKMIHVTQEAARLLGISDESLQEINVRDVFSDRVWKCIRSGSSSDLEETICCDDVELHLVLNIRPFFDEMTGSTAGAVIRFKLKKKNTPAVHAGKTSYPEYTFGEIIGKSNSIKNTIKIAKRFAASGENILLVGESGTGKELFAQAIHNEYCPTGPFIACNCAAIPRELVESELFGYEGGSFTGADRAGRPGKIELANGGTLFLDEIGDMPLDLQAVLLRVLEDNRVMRVGGQRAKKVDFRLIAATNRNLSDMVKEKSFREDLYFRISVLTIDLPPLRERKEDITVLAKHFIKHYCSKINRKTVSLSPQAEKVLREYSWPGNVRELKNAIIYALNVANDNMIKVNDLPPFLFTKEVLNLRNTREIGNVYNIKTMEKILIENALNRSKCNVTKAAEMLGIAKSTLYRKMNDYNIDIERYW